MVNRIDLELNRKYQLLVYANENMLGENLKTVMPIAHGKIFLSKEFYKTFYEIFGQNKLCCT